MTDHLLAAAAVVVDAPIQRLQSQAARCSPGHERMKAPAMPVDLHDVSDPYAFQPHPGRQSRRPLG